jgi:AAA domain/Primase C terminal 2 (PriCT-2)
VPGLEADREQLALFVSALFRYSDSDTFASLRAFDQLDRTVRPPLLRAVQINGDLTHLADEAYKAAGFIANTDRAAVFCPPICTFSNGDTARVADLANGLTLSVEIDDGDTRAARTRLEHLLGPATIIVESGGEWSHPDTGEIFPKLHLHWRLSEPTREPDDHGRLRTARDLAARLVGADPTGKPVVHPLRWPGSWNRKGRPVLARIVAFNDAAEINLGEALEAVQDATEAAGLASVGLPVSSPPQAAAGLVASAMATIPNADVHYDTWVRYGYAVHRATGGEGFPIWEAWSQKSGKHDEAETERTWRAIGRALHGKDPPRTIGAGTIFFDAKINGWERSRSDEPPSSEADPGYWQAILADAPHVIRDDTHKPKSHILSAQAFMADFIPPDYVIDGIIQRGRLYALTSPTGHGKTAVALYQGCMVAAGRNLGALEVSQGTVIFLAGENPDDLRCRLYAACQAYAIDPATLPLYVLPGNFPLTAESAETLKREVDVLDLNPVLVVVDTAAAYFHGDDDNHNVQMGAYARNLRTLTTCKGMPAVLTPAHPVKNPDKENLLPRGGGAFLNEIDGNLTLWSSAMGETAALHWQGKFRGPDFVPVNFTLQQVTIRALSDRKGRPIVSIVASIQTDDQAETAVKAILREENTVLEWMRRYPDISIKDIALNAKWVAPSGAPLKSKVHRLMKSLQRDKLVTLHRSKWKLTDAGKKELDGDAAPVH